MILTSVDLPAPLKAQHLAALERKVDLVQRMDGAEMLDDGREFENGSQAGPSLRLFPCESRHATLVC